MGLGLGGRGTGDYDTVGGMGGLCVYTAPQCVQAFGGKGEGEGGLCLYTGPQGVYVFVYLPFI